MYPEQLARSRIERNYAAPRSGRRVHHAIDHQRRSFQLEFGAIPDVVGLEAPSDFETAEVGAVDLVERPVPAAREIRRVGWPPFHVFWGQGGGAGYQSRHSYESNGKELPLAHIKTFQA